MESSPASTGEVEWLGSHQNGMAVIYPSDNSQAIQILRELNSVLQKSKVRKELDSLIQTGTDKSLRRIQGNRIEIFVHANGKLSSAFDTIIGSRLPVGAKDIVLSYARRQARKDPRLADQRQSGRESYEYGNFSLICNFDKCDAQAPHIDLISPNHQFGLMLSDNAPGTLFFESHQHVKSVDSLVQHWQFMARVESENKPHDPVQVPPALVEAILGDSPVRLLLDHYGDVLIPEPEVLQNMIHKESLPTGSIISLPGSVIHAGPASCGFRAVIFFSGWPRGSNVSAYDPDVQYTGTLLMGHLASLLWRREGIGFRERYFLLQRLAQYIEESTVRGMWGHFGPGELCNFVGNIERKSYRKTFSRDDYIHHMAQSATLGVPGYPFGGHPIFDINQYQRVSVPVLYTLWDGIDCLVEVYRRKTDGKIVLRYPTDGETDEFEGGSCNENFKLDMFENTNDELFDGKNGKLLDTDGEEIEFYQEGHLTI